MIPQYEGFVNMTCLSHPFSIAASIRRFGSWLSNYSRIKSDKWLPFFNISSVLFNISIAFTGIQLGHLVT